MRIGGAGGVGALRRACGIRNACIAIVALGAGGCSVTGQMIAPIADVRGTTVAFESIDGPPLAIVHRIVRNLNTEANARQIIVIERGGAAMYRARGYLATHAEQAGTSIAWAWDIYDTEQHRVFRLRGEDKAAAGARSWSAVDEPTLRRIARASIDQLVGSLATPRAPGSPEPDQSPPRSSSIWAGLDGFGPAASRMFQVLSAAPVAPAFDAVTEAMAAEVALPKNRPVPGRAPAAFASAERGR